MESREQPYAGSVHPELDRATVVVVDDEQANVVLLERILRAAGVGEVHGITDPHRALAACLDHDADLLMLDMLMPGMDGFAVMSAVREALPTDGFLPVVILTADASTVTRDRALMAGANDFVTKPFDRAEVVLRARNLLATRRLYLELQEHNASLQADLEAQRAQARRAAEELSNRRQRIDRVLDGDALSMVLQPIRELATGELCGVEALARFATEPQWPPNRWFEEAAAVGRGVDLELQAVRTALSELMHLPSELFLSVNVSPATALSPELPEVLGPAPARVVLELTEHTRIDDHELLAAAIAPVRRSGVRLAVDDAGAGYAGLRQILRLRPDIIKLDIELTRGIDQDPARRALATAMVAFASDIGARIVAEGIETADEVDTLLGVGVEWGQGYHLGRPDAPSALTAESTPTKDHG